MIEVRAATLEDRPKLMRFWTVKGLPEVPRGCLPDLGLVAELVLDDRSKILVAGAYLATSNTATASIVFVSANPSIAKEVRSHALDLVLMGLSTMARKSGFKVMAVSSNVPALIARYERLGFTRTDEDVVCLAARL